MTGPRCYTTKDVCGLLKMSPRTFFKLKPTMPFLEELKPRIGRTARYRVDLVDRYLDGQWGQPRAFQAGRRQRPVGQKVSR